MGSISAALSSGGTFTAAQLFAPYGGVRYSSGTMPTARGFTGQYADATTGLMYYGARYYDPVAAQFTSADLVQGPNRYAYVAGNPTNYTDPSGHEYNEDEGGGDGGLNAGSLGGMGSSGGGNLGGDGGVGAGGGPSFSDGTVTLANGDTYQVWDDGNMVTVTGPDGQFLGTEQTSENADLMGTNDPSTFNAGEQEAEQAQFREDIKQTETESQQNAPGTQTGNQTGNPGTPNTPSTEGEGGTATSGNAGSPNGPSGPGQPPTANQPPSGDNGGNVMVGTSDGVQVPVPSNWSGRTVDNGQGTVYQQPGAPGNANMVRIMDPTARYPQGYMRYYNQYGQPLDAFGKPGSRATTHFSLDIQGGFRGTTHGSRCFFHD